ncbi:FRG domain-containing protein [Bacteroides acidifaciens]|uniref:FRG domain-containing protein n=1 Tax=Bacteroides acidifaciens TaxID=85831 RepID=UPI0023C7E8CA|nr:FRG domain-containing protein [Bacteroides acidifaciens]MDE6820916.1 FRG domain-containing protein [Bacteroides acidifaciens]
MRTGAYKEALATLRANIKNFESAPELKFELLLNGARLECVGNQLGISSDLSIKALGLAEELGEHSLIARAYMQIASMFAKKHHGLSIYFYRKAERLYDEAKDSHQRDMVRLERAFLSSTVYRILKALHPNHKNLDRLQQEAEEIITKIDFSNLNKFEQRHLRYYKAAIFRDIMALRCLIEEIEPLDALPDKCLYKDMFIGICMEQGKFELADEIADSFIADKKALYGESLEIKDLDQKLHQAIEARKPLQFLPLFIPKPTVVDATLLDILDNYALMDEIWELDKSFFRLLFPSVRQEGLFEPVVMSDGICRLTPLAPAFNVYYRGQSRQISPSKASLYRNGMTEVARFVERLKYVEFRKIIEEYPLTHFLRDTIVATAPDKKMHHIPLAIDHLALAQHYGIKTELLDITTDKFVAAFFATTYCKDDIYKPIVDNREEKGVLYRYSIPPMEMLPGKEPRLRAVGLQPFSRPGEQCGMVYPMTENEDFEKVATSIETFRHDRTVSEFIFNYTNRGRKLFPDSPMQSHATKICNSTVFSYDAFHAVKEEFYTDCPEEQLLNYLSERGITLVENIDFGFTEDEKDACIKYWQTNSDKFLSRIRIRWCYNGPIKFDE